MGAAEARGTHRLRDRPPWVLDDPFALVLVGPEWEEIAAETRAVVREPLARQGRAGVVARSRYAEDRLAASGHSQYVVLGAGLDSFAWRRPDLVGPLAVFEVDHPATSAWKRARAAVLALPTHERHVFVPVDFEAQALRDGLDAAGFDPSRPALFAAVGVAMYLTAEALETTLRAVSTGAAGSEVVFSYNVALPFLDDAGREYLEAVSQRVARTGESLRSSFSPADAEVLVERCGLVVAEHPTTDDLCDRYFSGRPDGLRPYTLERLLSARVPG